MRPCVEILVDHGLMVTSMWPVARRGCLKGLQSFQPLSSVTWVRKCINPINFEQIKKKEMKGATNRWMSWSNCLILGGCIKNKKDKKGPRHWVSDYKHLLLQWNLPQRSLPRSAKASKIQEIRTNAMEVLIVHSAQHLQNSRHITASKGPKSGRHRIHDTNARDCSSPCMSQPRLRLNPVATTLDCCESSSTSCCLEHSHTKVRAGQFPRGNR